MDRAKHNPGISWFWLAAGFAGAYALYKMAQPEEAAAAEPEPTPAGSSPEGASALTPSASASAEPMPATPASPKAAESKEPKAQEPSRPPKLTRPSPRLRSPGVPARPKRQFQPSAQSDVKSEVSAAETPRGAGALRKP